MACFANINVSQGSVATYATCGDIFDIQLTANLPRNLPVKKILKSVKISQNYGHGSVAPVFGQPCKYQIYFPRFTRITYRFPEFHGIPQINNFYVQLFCNHHTQTNDGKNRTRTESRGGIGGKSWQKIKKTLESPGCSLHQFITARASTSRPYVTLWRRAPRSDGKSNRIDFVAESKLKFSIQYSQRFVTGRQAANLDSKTSLSCP